MASKRLGSILTDVTGTARQILRVNSSETGFEFYSQQTLPTYTITNNTVDRVIDAASTGLDELANVASTLINDLTSIMNGPEVVSTFQWSDTEQVWPFQLGPSGQTCYAKRVSSTVTSLTNFTTHGITFSKIIHCTGMLFDGVGPLTPIPFSHPAGLSWHVGMEPNATSIQVTIGSSWSAYGAVGSTITFYIIYTKT